jgi:hypothetical protein
MNLALVLTLSIAFCGCRKKKGGASGQKEALASPSATSQAPSNPAQSAADSARFTAAVEAAQAGRASPEQQFFLNQRLLDFEMRQGRPAGSVAEMGHANTTAKSAPSKK